MWKPGNWLVKSDGTRYRPVSVALLEKIGRIGPLAELQREDNPAIRDDLPQPVREDGLDRLPIKPQSKRFDKSGFAYDEQADGDYGPGGKPQAHRVTENSDRSRDTPVQRYVYTCNDCLGCKLVER